VVGCDILPSDGYETRRCQGHCTIMAFASIGVHYNIMLPSYSMVRLKVLSDPDALAEVLRVHMPTR